MDYVPDPPSPEALKLIRAIREIQRKRRLKPVVSYELLADLSVATLQSVLRVNLRFNEPRRCRVCRQRFYPEAYQERHCSSECAAASKKASRERYAASAKGRMRHNNSVVVKA